MLNVEIMWGAMFFGALHLITGLIMIFLLYKLLSFLWKNKDDISNAPEKEKKSFKKYLIASSVVVIIGLFLSSGAVKPKVTLNPIQNRTLIEYQNNNAPVTIITPPPRTEHLEGFVPLKKD
jgi:predicted histidine transporter YuiF (NhaC family)